MAHSGPGAKTAAARWAMEVSRIDSIPSKSELPATGQRGLRKTSHPRGEPRRDLWAWETTPTANWVMAVSTYRPNPVQIATVRMESVAAASITPRDSDKRYPLGLGNIVTTSWAMAPRWSGASLSRSETHRPGPRSPAGSHSMAVRSNGSLWAWGLNQTASSALEPPQPRTAL